MSHPTGMFAGEGEAELVYLGEKRIDGLVTHIIRGKEQTSGWREGENRKMEGKESKDWIQRKLLKKTWRPCVTDEVQSTRLCCCTSVLFRQNRLTPVEGRGRHMTSILKKIFMRN